ncbi:hypothetical protein HZS_7931 [Henneguya salminicola]|nr:hypothetical protein HZS_7931 [Henneguya salminicola]
MALEIKTLYKVILIGDESIGKTALVNRINRNIFLSNYEKTNDYDFELKELKINNKNIILRILSTSSIEKFTALKCYFSVVADAVILCFDITNLSSFESIVRWKNDFLDTNNTKEEDKYCFFLASTKMDLENRMVEDEKIVCWCANNNDIPYFETSAKNNFGVKELLMEVAKELIVRKPIDETILESNLAKIKLRKLEKIKKAPACMQQ